MSDDGGDWFTDADDAPAAEAETAPASAGEAPAAAGEAAPSAGEEAAGEEAGAAEAPHEEEYLDPDKLLLFKHWIRPKFLQYKYLYDYRHNYYDDVIDYLNRRDRGISREVPVAQTWAERCLRTYNSKIDKIESYRRKLEESRPLPEKKQTRRSTFMSYHSKEYMRRRYVTIL